MVRILKQQEKLYNEKLLELNKAMEDCLFGNGNEEKIDKLKTEIYNLSRKFDKNMNEHVSKSEKPESILSYVQDRLQACEAALSHYIIQTDNHHYQCDKAMILKSGVDFYREILLSHGCNKNDCRCNKKNKKHSSNTSRNFKKLG